MQDPNKAPETVCVKFDNEQGFYIINKDDFDAEKHEHFEGDIPSAVEVPSVDHAVAAAIAENQAKDALEGAIKPAWAQ